MRNSLGRVHGIMGLAMQLQQAWSMMLICSVLGLWYLPFGTLLSVLQIILLVLPAVRNLYR